MRYTPTRLHKTKTQKGFTLIELLVVISIIALLASIVLVSLSTVKNRAKDAKIKSELKTIQLVLEQYSSEHGGYPNPDHGPGVSPTSYCIGATDCMIAGESVSEEFPELDDTVAKSFSNLAALAQIFPSFTQNISFTDEIGNENKGYVYVSCGGESSVCDAARSPYAYVIYPSQDGVKALKVGPYSEVGCGLTICQSDYGNNCGPSDNESCQNYTSDNTHGYCNYDPNGQSQTGEGSCVCGGGSGNCALYCSTDQLAPNYDQNGTGACAGSPFTISAYPYCTSSNATGNYTEDMNRSGWCAGSSNHFYGSDIPLNFPYQNGTGVCITVFHENQNKTYCPNQLTYSCQGTPNCSSNSLCTNVQGCSMSGGTVATCAGTPNCGNLSTCTNVQGCSIYGQTPDSCQGSPNCNTSDESKCGYTFGCQWSNSIPGYCDGVPNISCPGDEFTCSETPGCSWNGYSCSTYLTCDSTSCSNGVSGCYWVPPTPGSCSGYASDTCNGGDSGSCELKNGCYWGGGTSGYCTGSPSDTCNGNQSTCGDKSGCSWDPGTPSQCTGTPSDTCNGNQSTCGDKSGCSWLPN